MKFNTIRIALITFSALSFCVITTACGGEANIKHLDSQQPQDDKQQEATEAEATKPEEAEPEAEEAQPEAPASGTQGRKSSPNIHRVVAYDVHLGIAQNVLSGSTAAIVNTIEEIEAITGVTTEVTNNDMNSLDERDGPLLPPDNEGPTNGTDPHNTPYVGGPLISEEQGGSNKQQFEPKRRTDRGSSSVFPFFGTQFQSSNQYGIQLPELELFGRKGGNILGIDQQPRVAELGIAKSSISEELARDDIVASSQRYSKESAVYGKPTIDGQEVMPNTTKYAVWGAPLGIIGQTRSESNAPYTRVRALGGMLGFSYLGWQKGMIGGTLSYVSLWNKYGKSRGSNDIQQGLATIFGAWYGDALQLQSSISGGGYHIDNKRRTGSRTATSSINGGVLSANLELYRSFQKGSNTITPFGSLNIINNWMGELKESEKYRDNIRIDSFYSGILRTTIGLRFLQTMTQNWGVIQFLESGSYVNQAVLSGTGNSFVFASGGPSLGVTVFKNRVQNLGRVILALSLVPYDLRWLAVTFNYSGEFGSNQALNSGSIELTKRF